nr:hypothetical protein [Mycoplasmopsis bovis]
MLSGYKEAIKRHAYKVGANNKVFQTINFGNKGENSSINIARFKSAIGFAKQALALIQQCTIVD